MSCAIKTFLKIDYRAQTGTRYYSARKNTPLEDRLIIKKEKFGKMALIWQVISTSGQRSRTFITNESLDATVHLKKCFKMFYHLSGNTGCLLSSGWI